MIRFPPRPRAGVYEKQTTRMLDSDVPSARLVMAVLGGPNNIISVFRCGRRHDSVLNRAGAKSGKRTAVVANGYGCLKIKSRTISVYGFPSAVRRAVTVMIKRCSNRFAPRSMAQPRLLLLRSSLGSLGLVCSGLLVLPRHRWPSSSILGTSYVHRFL